MISARVLAYSKSAVDGKEIVTWELEYPRYIHAEFMTHRVFSRNAASSRAIPASKVVDMIINDPVIPSHWGKNQSGMQAKEELTGEVKAQVESVWRQLAKYTAESIHLLSNLGLHKQVANRPGEAFQNIKVVATTTERENFFWLRDHEDAQPEIRELAQAMQKSLEDTQPNILKVGDWHLPYYGDGVWRDSGCVNGETKALYNKRDKESTLENALAISSSCCAQVSYRVLDDTLDKAKMIYQRLVESEPVHASPFEHQATPMTRIHIDDMYLIQEYWDDGITHVAKDGKFWSGNFQGFIQHRQLIPNNVKKG